MIRINNLCKSYKAGGEELKVLDNLTLTIADNSLTSIMGRSGSGKSTLLKIIGMLDNNYEGYISYDDVPIKDMDDAQLSAFRGIEIGFVFQDFQLISHLTVYKNLELALICAGKYDKEENDTQIQKALEAVELADKSDQKCRNLSGGQKQRVCIARAIVKSPKIVIADEPTGALDVDTADEIMKLFQRINEEGQTIIIVTHDEEVAKKCNETYYLSKGKIYDYKI